MNQQTLIRKAEKAELHSINMLYKHAFPNEDLFPLVSELYKDIKNTLNLVAEKDKIIVGHIAFTKCYATPKDVSVALLGPVAVLPEYQKTGIGQKLINEGFKILKAENVFKVLTLGDPDYYRRFGFIEESNIQPAYTIPDEWKSAWQSVALIDSPASPYGKLNVTKPWQKKELWS